MYKTMIGGLLLQTGVCKNIAMFKGKWIISCQKPTFCTEHLMCQPVGVSNKKLWKQRGRKQTSKHTYNQLFMYN